MSIIISAGNPGLSNGHPSGTVLQCAWGFNTVNGSATFGTRSIFGHVPGKLFCEIKPLAVNNKIVIDAHLFWGGWQGTDIAVNFRVMKRVNGSRWTFAGMYGGDPVPGTSGTYGVATGEYIYRRGSGDSNSSSKSDNLQVEDTVTSTDIHQYAIMWACAYDANSRTLLWNRANNYGNSYNPHHTCTIVATEYQA